MAQRTQSDAVAALLEAQRVHVETHGVGCGGGPHDARTRNPCVALYRAWLHLSTGTWKSIDPDLNLARWRAFKRRHPERVRAYQRTTFERHRDRILAAARAWAKAHPEVVRASQRKWYQSDIELHREKQREYRRRWKAKLRVEDPERYRAMRAKEYEHRKARLQT